MSEDSRKLLIVEDDPGLLKQLKWCFEDYDVFTAGDRKSAIAELRRHEPMVVLQDLGLPPNPEGVEEGLATLREILSLAPHTKVIVVTGNGDQENALTSVAQGAYDFYEKPVDTDTLKLLVDRAFNISELESENRKLQSQVNASPLDGIVAASEGMLAARIVEPVDDAIVTSASLSGQEHRLAAHLLVQRVVGFSNAADLLLSGRIFTGAEAASMGLVSEALPADQVLHPQDQGL